MRRVHAGRSTSCQGRCSGEDGGLPRGARPVDLPGEDEPEVAHGTQDGAVEVRGGQPAGNLDSSTRLYIYASYLWIRNTVLQYYMGIPEGR
jgi:hypothetical protein